jgi:uncharacterized protein YdiU (UPF0061 family)
MGESLNKNSKADPSKIYPAFDLINGEHPFKDQVPEGRVEYKARFKKGGRVAFFNFELAKTMGLIPRDHVCQLNPELQDQILKTFSLVIINEYDILNKVKFSQNDILPNTFMATRYLQLQHPDKSGRTSGDGRTIWNGVIENNGVTWDISSCGTGATKLSPACNINKKFYQTGDPSISYGCGLSELSEGLETLFFSEVLSKNGFQTERVLAIIEFDKGLSINVRAHVNLMRPSHFFCHLKQSNFVTLKQVADYYIERQFKNGIWERKNFENDEEKYFFLAQEVAKSFSEIAAKFEDEYIFCWLDWDGDNILMDGGIIDYGSIRQFGLFHSEYRFDDAERYSTTILEQKNKARYIVQSFIQIADYLSFKKKKPLENFRKHELLDFFESNFIYCKNLNILQKIGFKKRYADVLLNKNPELIKRFRKSFDYFERSKSKRGPYKVADGITRDAIFCMRDILREFPQIYLARQDYLTDIEFIEIIKSSYAKKNDLKLTKERRAQIKEFQESYLELVLSLQKDLKKDLRAILLEIIMRSSVINKYERVTGDSIAHVVQKVQRKKPKLGPDDLYQVATEFSNFQNLNPDRSEKYINKRIATLKPRKSIMRNLFLIVRDFREGL